MNKFLQYTILSFSFLCIANTVAASPVAAHDSNSSISANPAAVNIVPGSGTLQRYLEKKLDIKNNHGIYINGLLISDANNLFSGGIPNANSLTSNNLFILGLTVDTKKLINWDGGLFGVQFLQFNGQATNQQAGTIQGYNSLPAGAPFNRSELYQLWFRQEFFNKKLVMRIGKVAPTLDFNNVVKPVPLSEEKISIPAVTGLIYTPIFVNASMIGVLPGYYNSAYGITINFVPTKQWYLSYGVYDGHLAKTVQTGLKGPHFNGSYFHIAETGLTWLIGKNQLPGTIGVGAWYQTGTLIGSPNLFEHTASGNYLFGSQRLWYKEPGVNNSGISAFYQYGVNDSSTLPMNKFVGTGLTAFGLIPKRLEDSMGIGAALSWLNQRSFTRRTELMYQAYYQATIIKNIYLEPVLSYIPTAAASPHLKAAWAGTARIIILF
jgi:porin